jgi:hypothetical protein
MLTAISSIPTSVREGFDVQDLPLRASTLSEDTLRKVFGGERCFWQRCRTTADCVRSVGCRRCVKSTYSPFGVCGYR